MRKSQQLSQQRKERNERFQILRNAVRDSHFRVRYRADRSTRAPKLTITKLHSRKMHRGYRLVQGKRMLTLVCHSTSSSDYFSIHPTACQALYQVPGIQK